MVVLPIQAAVPLSVTFVTPNLEKWLVAVVHDTRYDASKLPIFRNSK
ncbi:hypothetical protein [Scytonema sp. PRP1]